MDIRFFSIILFSLSSLTVNVSAQDVTKQLKQKIHQLNKLEGSEQEQLVSSTLTDAKNYDLDNINKVLNSKKYKERLNLHRSNAKMLLGLSQSEHSTPTSATETNSIGDRLVLFVSSSMPIHVLRNYARDIEKVKGVMIFRGTINGIDSFLPTAKFMHQVMSIDGDCKTPRCKKRNVNISIDPQRFEHHGINRVPALIFEKDMKIQAYCKEGDKGPRAQIKVYGDASLAGLANVIYQRTKEPEIKAFLDLLRGI
ncbi:type-F conjugative transfer system pilin assembly protein TrbC [Thalassotalea marina]|uniref:Type-F conjugative transfer system pilin assembly protein TrbC n=1 Tax=Thalassotalea marina TaxID=1673741 RepID=A0A919BRP9_9GAMM|nr:type-F conjugative transfer system pilin assembly protein TrbC [Thalassotalea marina]GHG07110.1 hypothetical protein GCM10017161_40960 [Thalassotalea marina]